MQTYKLDGYTMTLQATDKRDKTGHIMVRYEFKTPRDATLFYGDDFGVSPLHAPESADAAKSLLSFLTLRKGDTDEEYFENYTPEQLKFSESIDCENLQTYAMDEV